MDCPPDEVDTILVRNPLRRLTFAQHERAVQYFKRH